MNVKSRYFIKTFLKIIKSPLFIVEAVLFFGASVSCFFIRTKFFTESGTSNLSAFFSSIPYILTLVIPVLCFRKNKNIYELFVPLKNSSLIIYKFLALCLSFCVMLLPLILLPVFVNFYGDVDFSASTVSFAFLGLFGFLSIAFSLFVSEIFTNDIVSFAVSFLLLVLINSLQLFSVYFSSASVLANVSRALSFSWHFYLASLGVFSFSDFIYFLVLIFVFVSGTILIFELKKGKRFEAVFVRRFIYFGIILVLCFLISGRLNIKLDFSQKKIYSVSSYSKKILNDSSQSVKITYYKSSSLLNLYPAVRGVQDFLEIYSSAGKNVEFISVDCDKEKEIQDKLFGYGIYPQRIRTENSNSVEFVDVYSCIVLESAGAIETIPFVLTSDSLEYSLDLKFLSLVYDYNPVVNILMGNGRKLEEDQILLCQWLQNQGFVYREVIPENLHLTEGPLYVVGESELSENEVSAIEEYILSEKGGVVIAANPYTVEIDSDWNVKENINNYLCQLLENWGIYFRPSLANDVSCTRLTLVNDENQNDAQLINYPLWISVLPQGAAKNGVNMFWPVPMELSENAVPVLYSTTSSWESFLDFNNPEKLCETNPFLLKNKFNMGENKQAFVLASALQGKLSGYYTDNVCTNGRVFVISDQYFSSYTANAYAGGGNGDFRNFMFLTRIFLDLNDNSELGELQEKTNPDRSLYKRKI